MLMTSQCHQLQQLSSVWPSAVLLVPSSVSMAQHAGMGMQWTALQLVAKTGDNNSSCGSCYMHSPAQVLTVGEHMPTCLGLCSHDGAV